MSEVERYSAEQIQEVMAAAITVGATKRYKKHHKVLARIATFGEVVETVINGELETRQTVQGDYSVVIKNITTESQEEYAIAFDKFLSRYDVGDQGLTPNWQEYLPTGEVDAYEWQNESAVFTAPWGEDMIIHKGDYLACIPGSVTDVYRIARDEFLHTYKLI